MPKKPTASIEVELTIKERVERFATETNRTPELVVADALGDYLDRVERHAQFLRETQEAARHYQETGLHLTHAEVDAWLEKLANGEEAELPECHT